MSVSVSEGDVVLARFDQSATPTKVRPAVALRQFAPFGDWLLCGISTQLHLQVVGFDELLSPGDADFSTSGVKATSLIRLGYLAVRSPAAIVAVIGSVSTQRHRQMLERLSDRLRP